MQIGVWGRTVVTGRQKSCQRRASASLDCLHCLGTSWNRDYILRKVRKGVALNFLQAIKYPASVLPPGNTASPSPESLSIPQRRGLAQHETLNSEIYLHPDLWTLNSTTLQTSLVQSSSMPRMHLEKLFSVLKRTSLRERGSGRCSDAF